ncbi:Hypothetical predicted protein [Paramuricea clavata]|uniref:Uncharacterized protein n=1 Tax=Paramuricea clavata TaxID=317549 RepID=A0A7D9I2F9_PARCT|nr:Hypothetical predicted protein [Paramuricea clavata]
MAELINGQEQILYEDDEEIIPEKTNDDDEDKNLVNDVADDDDNHSDHSSECSYSDYEGDIDEGKHQEEEINNETCALFLKQIWDAQRNCVQKRKQDRFLLLTKKFVNASFIKKEKMLNENPQLIKHMVFLCRNIANDKLLEISKLFEIFTPIAMGDDVKRLMLIDAEKYNTMMKTLKKLVEDKKILGEAKQTAAEGELIESHANMVTSIQRKSPYATNDIINYSKKKQTYLKEQKEAAAPPPPPQPAAGSGPAHKPGSLASSESLIRAHLKKKGVVETDKGVKFVSKTLNIAFDDMIADLTKNVKKTNTNLTTAQHDRLLKELKKNNKFLDTDNLDQQARNDADILPYYSGCYPADVTPKGTGADRCCWIWNVDKKDKPGTHWVAVVKEKNIIYFLIVMVKHRTFLNAIIGNNILKN